MGALLKFRPTGFWWGTLLGCALGLGFVWPILSSISIGALFYTLFLVSTQSVIKIHTATFLLGVFLGKALLALSWFWSTYPLSWVGDLSTETVITAISLYWVTPALWLGSAGLCIALGIISIYRVSGRAGVLLTLPALWVLAEWMGAVVFSVLTWGPGASIGGAFSFGHIGYLAPAWLWPYSTVFGVYTIGLLLVSILVAVVAVFLRERVWVIGGLCLVPIVVVVLTLLRPLPPEVMITPIAILETDFAALNTLDPMTAQSIRRDTLRVLVSAAASTTAKTIVLPEDSRFFATVYQADEVGITAAAAAWRLLANNPDALLIDTARTETSDGAVQRTYFVSGTSTNILAFDKQYLVPQGEFMPTLYANALRLFGLGPIADALQSAINYVPGPLVQVSETGQPAVMACFESVNPLSGLRLVQTTNAPYLIHPVSHAWFSEPTVLWHQLDRMLRIQALTTKRSIVMAGNEVQSAVYSPTGGVSIPPVVYETTYGRVRVWQPTP